MIWLINLFIGLKISLIHVSTSLSLIEELCFFELNFSSQFTFNESNDELEKEKLLSYCFFLIGSFRVYQAFCIARNRSFLPPASGWCCLTKERYEDLISLLVAFCLRPNSSYKFFSIFINYALKITIFSGLNWGIRFKHCCW